MIDGSWAATKALLIEPKLLRVLHEQFKPFLGNENFDCVCRT